jgi:hypothetical protein
VESFLKKKVKSEKICACSPAKEEKKYKEKE